jgi:hypothetical protein
MRYFEKGRAYGDGSADSIWRDPFSPFVLFTFSCCMEFAFTYIYALSGGVFATSRTRTLGLDLYHLHQAWLMFIIFYSGWIAAFWAVSRKRVLKANIVGLPRTSRGVLLATLIAVNTVFLIALFSHPNFGESRMLLVKGVYGYIFAVAQVLLLCMFAIVAVMLMSQHQTEHVSNKKYLNNLIALVICIVVVFFSLSLLQGRGRAFSVVFLSLMIWHYTQTRVPLWFFLLFMCTAVAGAIAISMSELSSLGYRPSFSDVAFGVQYRRNFDGLYNAATLIWHMSSRNEGFDYGVSIIREIIADLRPSDEGILGTRSYFVEEVLAIKDARAGVALSKVGEFYRAGGALGVLFGGVLLGAIAKVLYVQFARRQVMGSFSIPLYSFLLGGFGVASIRGYFGGKIVLAVALACVFVGLTMVFVKLLKVVPYHETRPSE